MCSSARPCRFRSTGTRSGREVIKNQITFPRRRVSPMKAASEANTRSDTPESAPFISRFPSAASASSMTTAIGPRASSRPRMRSRLASVCPCHIERKLSSSTTGIPISAAKQRTMKLLPVPTGPHTRKPIGTTSSRPWRSAAAVSRRSAFAPAFPATASRPVALIRKESRPPLASSISRFFSRASASGSSGAPFESASASRLSRCRRVNPDVKTATL